MARAFASASSQKLRGTQPLTALPLTIACWAQTSQNTANQTVVYLGNSGGTNADLYELQFGGAIAGDPVRLAFNNVGGTVIVAATSTGYSTNTWHHVCCTIAAANDKRVFIDGGSKGTSSNTEEPSGINRFSVGARDDATGSQFLDGQVAEVAVWNVALSDAEVALLASTRVSPFLIHPESLVFYAPLIGQFSPEIDIKGGLTLTVTGATAAAHPRIYQVPRGFRRRFTTGGATTYYITPGGALTPAGALTKRANTSYAGSMASAGALARVMNKALSGALVPTGALARVVQKACGGSLASAGALSRLVQAGMAGTLVSAGALVRQVATSVAGALTPSGALANTRLVVLSLAGLLTPSGTLGKVASKSLGGALTPSGALSRLANISLAGVMTPAGALGKVVTKSFAGVLALAGALANLVSRANVPGRAETSGFTLVHTAEAMFMAVHTAAGAFVEVAMAAVGELELVHTAESEFVLVHTAEGGVFGEVVG